MNTKQLIIALIQQDLKHHQLLNGLDSLGLECTDYFQLGLKDIIFQLMCIPDGLEDEFYETYADFAGNAKFQNENECESGREDEGLNILARVCYQSLMDVSSFAKVTAHKWSFKKASV